MWRSTGPHKHDTPQQQDTVERAAHDARRGLGGDGGGEEGAHGDDGEDDHGHRRARQDLEGAVDRCRAGERGDERRRQRQQQQRGGGQGEQEALDEKGGERPVGGQVRHRPGERHHQGQQTGS